MQNAPSEIDTLVLGLFDGIDDDAAGVYAGYHVAGEETARLAGETRRANQWRPSAANR